MNYKVEVLTGIRPTGDLTIANYIGAVKPIVKLQEQGLHPVVFVADLHAITDKEPIEVKPYIHSVVADYLALGIDPQKTTIYIQSYIAEEVLMLTAILSRLISVAELLRVPTLKDKLKKNAKPETANTFLLLYPVMMASDILIHRTKSVAVGEDQLPHIEVTRELARRFNKRYGEVFPTPQTLTIEPPLILSLKGEGKMSKTKPDGAIFLTDDAETVARKIKTAETAFEGVMNEKLKSLISIAHELAKTEHEHNEINTIIEEHMKGEPVMRQFKELLTRIVNRFLEEFQAKRAEITRDYIQSVLEEGRKIAKNNAAETLAMVREAMQI